MQKLEYLSTGLSLVLIFVGLKMLTKDLFHVPIIVSLSVVVLILAGSVVLSLMKRGANTRSEEGKRKEG
jgi:tellurite resistance protein TerC